LADDSNEDGVRRIIIELFPLLPAAAVIVELTAVFVGGVVRIVGIELNARIATTVCERTFVEPPPTPPLAAPVGSEVVAALNPCPPSEDEEED
jgi:hypothetical protein